MSEWHGPQSAASGRVRASESAETALAGSEGRSVARLLRQDRSDRRWAVVRVYAAVACGRGMSYDIVQATGLGVRRVQRALRVLLDRGLVERTEWWSEGGRVCVYRVLRSDRGSM